MEIDDHKISRLAGITDEVSMLHPLLNVLLKRLPDVNHVEKTHGPNEQGADFVLRRTDSSLGQTSFVAVIVKKDNIGPSNLVPIYTQIEQCQVERTFEAGKHKIRTNEIWVITSGTISHAARENIAEKYSNRNVRFIDRNLLIRLIDKHFPNYWTDLEVIIGDYLGQLVTEIDSQDKSTNILPNADPAFYVTQNIYRVRDLAIYQKTAMKKGPAKVDLVQEILSEQFILIEGDPGVGKSKLLRELARMLGAPDRFLKARQVPIVTTAKEFFIKFKADGLAAAKDKLGQSASLIDDPKNTFVLLIDGLDEAKKENAEVIQELDNLAKALADQPRFRVITTSRPLRMSAEQGEKKLNDVWVRMELFPLSNSQLIQFIKHLCKDLGEGNRLFEDIKHSAILSELPKSPIAAILLADIVRQKVEELPATLPDLYAKYFEITLGRWEMKKGLQSQMEYNAIEAILIKIASYLLISGLDYITVEEAREYFRSYLAERNLQLDADELLKKLQQRFQITSIDTKQNSFRFRHKTFAEFLYAKGLVSGNGATISKTLFKGYWKNSYYFYVGLKRDCPAILKAIVDLEPETEMDRIAKIAAVSGFLMAAYQSPYSVITECLKKTVLEAAKFCHEVLTLRQGEVAKMFSEMHFLWLFQYSFKRDYGYKFFEKAIVNVALEIAELDISDEEKALALFILSTTHIELGGKETFDFVLDDKVSMVPLCVQLGMRHEGEKFNLKDSRFKKFDKHLKKMMTGNAKLGSTLTRMYELPLCRRKDAIAVMAVD